MSDEELCVVGEAGIDGSGVEPVAGALRSQVACWVLGLVIEKPSYGYEIGQRFEERFGELANVGRTAIYGALRTLEAGGLIEKMGRSTSGVRRGAKAGPSYRATARGARAFRAWLAERVLDDPMRVEMLGRMVLAGIRGKVDALDFLDRFQQKCIGETAGLAAPEAESARQPGIEGVFARLLAEERRQALSTRLDWLTYAREEIRALPDPPQGSI